MKSFFALSVLLSLLLGTNLSCARKDPGDYWNNMMKGQAMPEAIKDLVQNPRVSDAGKDRFIRDFDIKPNVILYHTHVVSKKQEQRKPFVKNLEPEFKKSDTMVEQTIKMG